MFGRLLVVPESEMRLPVGSRDAAAQGKGEEGALMTLRGGAGMHVGPQLHFIFVMWNAKPEKTTPEPATTCSVCFNARAQNMLLALTWGEKKKKRRKKKGGGKDKKDE